MRTIILASALAVAGAVAQAGNLDPAPIEPVPAPPPAQTFAPLSGDWTGAYAGVQLGYGFADTSRGANVTGDGLMGGAHLGYDQDFGDFTLGVEGDFDLAGIDLTAGAGSIDSVGRLKLRAGIDAGPALFYATGGAAYANATIGGVGRDDWGWLGGAGVSYKITDSMTLGGEVLYHGFNGFGGTTIDVGATTLSARVGWRF